MNIAYLSGAYKNSGDFLIERRAIDLLKYIIPNLNVQRILRNCIEKNIDIINQSDVVVIGGGPIYKRSLKDYMSLDFYNNNIYVPTMILGGGWYGANGSSYEVQNYSFDTETKLFFDKIYNDGYGFSCRDLHTLSVLKRLGFNHSLMTGCPAWFDMRYIGQDSFRKTSYDIERICVSDPSRLYNFPTALTLIDFLKKKFPNSEITFIFHRGISSDAFTSNKTESVHNEVIKELQ